MKANVEIKYGIDDVMAEMGLLIDKSGSDIIRVKAEDTFFIGGGCESPYGFDNTPTKNLSICQDFKED